MKKILLSLTAVLAATAVSNAAIITQDSFLTGGANYTVGDLNGQNPIRTGASGAWTANTNYDINATGLTFTGLNTAGGRVAVTVAPTGNATAWHTATESASAPGLSPFYVSFLLRSDRTTDVRLGLGANNNRFIGTSQGFFLAGTATGGTFSVNTTYLLIAKISPNVNVNDERIQLWTHADGASIPISEAAAGTALIDSTGSGGSVNMVSSGGAWQPNFGWYYSNVNASNSYNASFDELRVGTSWADITPIPEPSTWALLAGSLTVLTLFRRRRQS